MRQFIRVIVLVLIISCNNQNNSNHIRVQQFEEILGNEKSDVLTKKVEAFEQFLNTNFENISIEKAYEKFLLEIESSGWDFDNWKFDHPYLDSLDILYEKSGLREEIWLNRDTVFYDGDYLCYSYHYINGEDTFGVANYEITDSGISHFDIIPKYEKLQNRDSILEIERTIIIFNIHGKFIEALDKVRDSDSTLIHYLDAKHDFHNMSPSIIASGLLYDKPDFSDYFVKRVIVAELF